MFLLIIVYNVITLFLFARHISSEGEILRKEKEVYQNVKVPEFNYYFIIADKSGKTMKYKTNQVLFNLYNETDKINFKYDKRNNEIVDINK